MEPDEGLVHVTVTVSGRVPDRDGFSVHLGDTQAGALTAAAPLSVPGVQPGQYTVRLRGVSRNCVVQGDSAKSVTVSDAATANVAFEVSCPGTGMAYVSSESGPRKLMIRYPWSTAPELLVDSIIPALPSWSPDGYSIAFVRDGFDGQRIWTIDTETGVRRKIGGSGFSYAVHPTWSPDGTRIAYTGGTGWAGEIRVINLDLTGDVAVMPGSRIAQSQPAWSPDGRRIAFKGSESSTPDLYVMNSDGSGLVKLNATPTTTYTTLSWSPDGAWLAYTGSTNSHDDIFVVRPDGRDNTNLTRTEQVEESHPYFRRNGRITYTRIVRFPTAEPWDIWEMSVDGTGIVNLTNTPLPHEQLAVWQ